MQSFPKLSIDADLSLSTLLTRQSQPDYADKGIKCTLPSMGKCVMYPFRDSLLAKPSKGGAFHQHHQFQKGLLWNTKISFKRDFRAHVGHISACLGGLYGMVAFLEIKTGKQMMLVNGLGNGERSAGWRAMHAGTGDDQLDGMETMACLQWRL